MEGGGKGAGEGGGRGDKGADRVLLAKVSSTSFAALLEEQVNPPMLVVA